MKIGTSELVVILLIILVLFGSTLIPKMRKMVKDSKESYKEGYNEKK